jgi:transmembrane sensor
VKSFPRKRPGTDDAVEARAAAWLAQRDDGFTADDEAAFSAWRDADPRHAAAVARLDAAWQALGQLRSYRPAARAHPDPDLLQPRMPHRVLAFPAAALAGLAAAIVVAFVVWQWNRSPAAPLQVSTQVYTTTVGGYQRLTLTDGSVVELNDSSEVRVRYTPEERRVQLVHGEAHFTVAKNKARPFFVETRGVAVRAVGTAFDVRLAPAQVEIFVTEGIVQLHRTAGANTPHSGVAGESPLLGAGWRAVVPVDPPSALTMEMIGADRLRDALTWQGPRHVFVETPLAEVVEQFNRRNQIQLALGDAELANLPVGGSFRAENVETFVRLLASSGEISVERPDPQRIILHKAR